MKTGRSLRVASPPPKALLIWDGDCQFCRLWIERWRETTGGEVDYVPYQEVADRFPEISSDEFAQSVLLIQPNGEVFFAAEAIYRSLQCRSRKKWKAWSYDHVPAFAALSEIGYRLIANHRRLASAVTRLLWGNDVRPPTYFWARRWFTRGLAAIYLIAFVSLWFQIDGLIGKNGIWPISQVLPAAYQELGSGAFWVFPTLCWFNSSNALLHFLCGGGVVFSVLLMFEIAPAVSLVLLFVFYLSLTIAGQTFLSFQWDVLLLETGFLSIAFVPWQFWLRRGNQPPVSRLGLFLLKFLLFKLMVMSGVVKLTSGDSSWWDLTALDYHYWSQPLPTIFAWYADKSPESFKHFSVAFCLIAEILIPFFIWAPRRPRLIAAGLLIFLQVAIGITGNYCFFNLLSIALCLLLIDDAVPLVRGRKVRDGAPGGRALPTQMSMYAAVVMLLVTLPLNAWLIFTAFNPEAEWPRPLSAVYSRLEPFRIANGYGLFRVMTKDRLEIVLEGSANGIDWTAYEFKWKPGDVMRAPGWCAPHQPRLDWQMWFAALGTPQDNPWLMRVVICLLQGRRDVERLLARDPFPTIPPHYIRATSYRYRFTTMDQHRQTGAWWKRQELREYLPAISLDQLR